jgi:hypothetical protein
MFEYDYNGKIQTGIFLSEKEMIEKLKSVLNVKTYGSYKKMKSAKGFDGFKLDSKNQNIDIANSYVLINLEGASLLSIKIKVVTFANKSIIESNLRNLIHLISKGYQGNQLNTNQINNTKKASPEPKFKLKIINYTKDAEQVYYKVSVKQAVEDLKAHYQEGTHLKIHDTIQPDGTIMEGADIWATLEHL